MLARRFGLARGFDVYDDALPAGQVERTVARDDRARARLPRPGVRAAALSLGPLLRSARALRAAGAVPQPQYAKTPYLGEVAAMDEQLGRLVQAFERTPRARQPAGDRRRRRSRRGPRRSRRVAARQPALPVDDARAAGDGGAGRRGRRRATTPVSTRRVFHTLLDWAGPRRRRDSLRAVDVRRRGESCSARR